MLFASLAESNQYHQLRHPFVRDLAWCCLSPPLLSSLPGSQAQILPLPDADIWPWLHALDKTLAESGDDQVVALKHNRLGIYYENLWRFYFTHSPQWQLLAHNLPVIRNKATLGAFDFLCRHGDDYWHIETAVKFYLCQSPDPQAAQKWEHWLGPNSQDRLDLKLSRLRDHQLPLHQTPEAVQLLQTHFPAARQWLTGLCLQGYLFSPAPADVDITKLQPGNFFQPYKGHEYHARGLWWYLKDFLALLKKEEAAAEGICWIMLQPEQWLSPIQLEHPDLQTENIFFADALIQRQQQLKRPIMIAAVKQSIANQNSTRSVKLGRVQQWHEPSHKLSHELWQEQWRGFVVPDNWPAPAVD
jgi:hypothetical protein